MSAGKVGRWCSLPSPNSWQVTPETARLLQHWRHHKFAGMRNRVSHGYDGIDYATL